MVIKKISISLISLSAVVLLLLSIVPHHHHEGGVTHFLTACCAHHESDDEGHEWPQSSDHHEHKDCHHQSCISESEFIISNSGSQKKCGLAACDHCEHDQHHPFPLYFLTPDCIVGQSGYTEVVRYDEYLLISYIRHINLTNGLRAPPFFLS